MTAAALLLIALALAVILRGIVCRKRGVQVDDQQDNYMDMAG